MKTVGASAGVLLVLLLCFLSYIGFFNGNIRTVVPNRVYRSAQLGPEKLERLIQKDNLRTVISLRGGDADDAWFRKEQSVCSKYGVDLEVIHLSATRLPKPKDLVKLLELFDRSQYPLLFHCRGGADRTGLAATLYLHLYQGLPLEKARAEGLTWRYGHFPVEAVAMDHFFDMIQKEKPANVREWILNRYPVVYGELKGRKERRASAALAPATAGIR